MSQTHLAHALLAITGTSSIRALATACHVSPSTLSRLISDERRIDEETLRKICQRNPDQNSGLRLLIAHLRDEIDRAGRLQTEVQISPAAISDEDDDILLLQEDSQTDEDLRAIVHDLARMARAIRRKKAAGIYGETPPAELKVAEDIVTDTLEDLRARDAAAAGATDSPDKSSPIPRGPRRAAHD